MPRRIRLSEYRQVIKKRPFLAYLSGQTISAVGDGTVAITFAFAALRLDPTGGVTSAVLIALWVCRTAFVGLGGRLADRWNPVLLALIGDGVRLLAQLVPVWPWLSGHESAWVLVLSGGLYGVGAAFFKPGSARLRPLLVDRANLQPANSLLGIGRGGAYLLGPSIGALLVSKFGVAQSLIFDAATFAVSIISLLLIARPVRRACQPGVTATSHPADETSQPPASRLGAVRTVLLFPPVAIAIVQLGLADLVSGSLNVMGPVMADSALGGIGRWAPAVTALSIGGLVGGFAAGTIRLRRPLSAAILLTGIPLPVAVFSLSQRWGLATICALMLIGNAGNTMGAIGYDSFVQGSVPNHMLGRIASVEAGVSGVALPLGTLICVPLSRLVGAPTYLAALAGVILSAAVLVGCLPIVRDQQVAAQSRGRRAPPGADTPDPGTPSVRDVGSIG